MLTRGVHACTPRGVHRGVQMRGIVRGSWWARNPMVAPFQFRPATFRKCARALSGKATQTISRGLGHFRAPPDSVDLSEGAIHLSSMSDANDVDEQYVVNYFVKDPVVAHAHPVHGVLTCQCDTGWWPGVLGKELDCGSDALLVAALEGGENFGRASSDANLISGDHFSPSSAFT